MAGRGSYSDLFRKPQSQEEQQRVRRENERSMFFFDCRNAPTVSTPPPFVQGMFSVKDYLKFKEPTIVSNVYIGRHECIKLTEVGVHVIRGLILLIVDEVHLSTIRNNIEEDDILVNDKKVELKHDPLLTTPNATDSDRNDLLRKVISLIYNLCGESKRLIPLDLRHLLGYFSKMQAIREHNDFIFHHPALWNAIHVEKMILSIDITRSIKAPRNALNIATARIHFLWKADFKALVMNNAALNQHGFYLTIRKIWTNNNCDTNCRDDIKGFLHFMKNIFTHVYDELVGVSVYRAESHQAKAIWDFMHALKPDFLYLLYTSIFYVPEYQPYFICLM